MRRFMLTLALLLVAAALGLHGTAQASGPAQKPAPTGTVHGRPVYNVNTLKHTPGVTFTKTLVKKTSTTTGPSQTAPATQSSVYTGSGYAFGYIYSPYYQVWGEVYQYDYILTAYWYGVPLCVQGTQNTYVYGNVPVRATLQLYLSYFGGFQSYSTQQGWTTSSIYLSTGCYGTIGGDTWYNLGSFACGASYYCSGSAVAQWTDLY